MSKLAAFAILVFAGAGAGTAAAQEPDGVWSDAEIAAFHESTLKPDGADEFTPSPDQSAGHGQRIRLERPVPRVGLGEDNRPTRGWLYYPDRRMMRVEVEPFSPETIMRPHAGVRPTVALEAPTRGCWPLLVSQFGHSAVRWREASVELELEPDEARRISRDLRLAVEGEIVPLPEPFRPHRPDRVFNHCELSVRFDRVILLDGGTGAPLHVWETSPPPPASDEADAAP